MRLLVAGGVALVALLAVHLPASFSLYETISAPAAKVKHIIVDLPRFTRLHPLAVSCRLIASSPSTYEVIDRVSVLGLWDSTLLITAVLTEPDERTVLVETSAPLGVRTRSKWSVKEGADGRTEVSEEFTIWAPLGLLWFSKSTAHAAHVNLLAALKRAVQAE